MYTARIVVLTIALSAGVVAAYLASGSDNKSLQTEPVVQLRTVDVLVARSDIGLGQSVAPEDLQSRTWPTATASNSFIRRNEPPDATTQVAGSIARAPFIAGEPSRENIYDQHAPKRGESVNVVRYGVSTLATTQN